MKHQAALLKPSETAAVDKERFGGLRKERKDVGRRASPHPTPARDAPRPEAGGDSLQARGKKLMKQPEVARSAAAPCLRRPANRTRCCTTLKHQAAMLNSRRRRGVAPL
ncbi:MAG: hypothetical protein LBD24_06265 [Spirochaetaceae bacterium]|nr:hypothetical protein [Spirochaetaceae bacterium]